MRKRLLRAGLAFAVCVLLCTATAQCAMRLCMSGSTRTQRNEIDFYRRLLYARLQQRQVYLTELAPVEWDTVRVFRAYDTAQNKLDFAGYAYADDLVDLNHEDMLSLLFMKKGQVVYYVDALAPRKVQWRQAGNGLYELSMGGWYSVPVDAAAYMEAERWGYYPLIEEAHKEDEPYIELETKEDGLLSLTVKSSDGR